MHSLRVIKCMKFRGFPVKLGSLEKRKIVQGKKYSMGQNWLDPTGGKKKGAAHLGHGPLVQRKRPAEAMMGHAQRQRRGESFLARGQRVVC